MSLRGSALAQLAAAIARVSTTDELLEVVPGWAIEPLSCQYSTIALVEEDRSIQFNHPTSVDDDVLERWSRRPGSRAEGAGTATADAVSTGQPVLCPTLDAYRERYPDGAYYMEAGGFESVCCFPLHGSGGEVVGVFSACWSTPNKFDPDTVDTIATIAEIIALAIERTRAADSRDRISAGLARLAATFTATTTSDDVARVVPELISDVLGSRSALVSLVDHENRVLRSPHQAEAIGMGPLSDYATVSLDDVTAPRVIAATTGETFLAPDITRYRKAFPQGVADLEASGIAALAMIPFRDSSGTVIGVLAVGWSKPTPFDDALADLLQAVADLCAQTIERTRLFDSEHLLIDALARSEAREREVAETLQRSLLPATLPRIDTLTITVRYRPGVEGLEVGGDWYDVMRLPDGRVGLSVGDVVGRGIHAAAAMGQLRSALNALAPYSPQPSVLLDRLDAFAQPLEPARYATVAYGILDPGSRQLDYACAGHPPPLLLPPEGPATFLVEGRSTPLTAATMEGRSSASVGLPPASTLILYSDGLIERRGESITRGLERLAHSAERHRGHDQGTFCDLVLDDLVGATEHNDDVVMLVTHLGGPTDTLHHEMEARAQELSALRLVLREWLVGHGTTAADIDDVVLVCSEAANNAVEHAYRDAVPARVTLSGAFAPDGTLTLVVRDTGTWRPPTADPERGRGLPIMEQLTSRVDVVRTPAGTTVTMLFFSPGSLPDAQ